MLVGCGSRPPDDITISPKRPSWKCSVTESVWWKRTSMPSKRSRYGTPATGAGTGSVTSTGVTVAVVPQLSTTEAVISVCP